MLDVAVALDRLWEWKLNDQKSLFIMIVPLESFLFPILCNTFLNDLFLFVTRGKMQILLTRAQFMQHIWKSF